MAPKKAAETSTSPEKEVKSETTDASEEPSKAVKKVPAHPPTMEMIKEALKELDQRKGVSAQAIRSYIKEKYTTMDESRIKLMVRKALIKGIESGVFVRPANSSTTTGAQGRFRLAIRKPKDAKPAKKSKENSDPNTGKAKEAKAGDVKKTKSVTEGAKPKKAKSDAAASKVAPAKKPKAKRSAETEDTGSKTKTQKTSKKAQSKGDQSGKSSAKKGGKKAAQKAEEGASDGAEVTVPKKGSKRSEDAGQGAAAPKKGVKKAAQKAEDGGGEKNAGAIPKAAGKKSKKAAEK
ncbi:protein B4 [Trichomycterus rosablanca]|uniref:protein B4 n=1 Tax=Trichomycterus rosablanca TaxID=2290929 RepID=UPI002F359475